MAKIEGDGLGQPIDWERKTERVIIIDGQTVPVVFGIDPTEDFIEPSHDIRVAEVASVALTEGRPSTDDEIPGPKIVLMTQAGIVGPANKPQSWIPDSLRDRGVKSVSLTKLVRAINVGPLAQSGRKIDVVAACSGLSMDMKSPNPFGYNVLFSTASHSDGFGASIMSFGSPDTTSLTMSVPSIGKTTNVDQFRAGSKK